jgi:RNA polymerase sigma-70 factor (ECF subfamily)
LSSVYYSTRGLALEINSLIDEIINGNTALFEQIVNRYQKPIFAFLLGMGISSQILEDLAQDVFLSAYQHLNDYDRTKSQFSTWLFSIAKNKAFNHTRKKKIKSFFGFVNEGLDQNFSPNLFIDQLQNNIQHEILYQSVNSLPEKFKVCAVLYFYNDLKLEEIAKIEKCSLGTVKSRLFRAKESLKINLSERSLI